MFKVKSIGKKIVNLFLTWFDKLEYFVLLLIKFKSTISWWIHIKSFFTTREKNILQDLYPPGDIQSLSFFPLEDEYSSRLFLCDIPSPISRVFTYTNIKSFYLTLKCLQLWFFIYNKSLSQRMDNTIESYISITHLIAFKIFEV